MERALILLGLKVLRLRWDVPRWTRCAASDTADEFYGPSVLRES
jgi:hypothetical protein